MKETICNCQECIEMCKDRPCWGTPAEVKRIIKCGFEKRLMLDYWIGDGPNNADIFILSPAIKSYETKPAPFWPKGTCTFLINNGKCEIHDLKLKPLEGRIANHRYSQKSLHKKVAMTWNNKKAQALVEAWRKKFSI